VTKADKGETVVITDKGMCNQKIENFLQENQFVKILRIPHILLANKNNRLYKNSKLQLTNSYTPHTNEYVTTRSTETNQNTQTELTTQTIC
jgi:hypothetical protein